MVTCQAQECRLRPTNPLLVTLYLTEEQVAGLLTPADAVAVIESCFARMARGAVENRPRYRLRLEHGALAVMAAADLELGYAGAKVYAGFQAGARFVVLLYRTASPELVAVIDADKLGQLRTGAASAVAAKHLARSGASTLGVIGCGWQAESQVACIRAAVPGSSLPEKGRPAADSPTMRRLLPASAALAANPSTALEGNAGSAEGARMSWARTRPAASPSATRSGGNTCVRSSTSAAASSASTSGYVDALMAP